MENNKDLNDLYKLYPEAFDSRYTDGFYFECGSGWYDIIEPVIKAIEAYNKSISDAEKEQWEYWKLYPVQVKEKFGTLRFYTNFGATSVDEAINKAEQLSCTTCMTCGKPGQLMAARWLYTACPEHTREGDEPYDVRRQRFMDEQN